MLTTIPHTLLIRRWILIKEFTNIIDKTRLPEGEATQREGFDIQSQLILTDTILIQGLIHIYNKPRAQDKIFQVA
jgi:hypothetical protein